MTPNEAQRQIQQMEIEFQTEGRIRTQIPEVWKQTAAIQQRYEALIRAERLLPPGQVPLYQRWNEPTPEELQRGAQQLLQRLQRPNPSSIPTQALPEAKVPTTPKQAASSSPWWSPFVSWLATPQGWTLVGATCVLFFWLGTNHFRSPTTTLPGWFGSKGPSNVSPERLIHLSFGVGSAKTHQPQTRGKPGMNVFPGSWIYFILEQGKAQGNFLLLERTPSGTIQQLYPLANQDSIVQTGPRRSVLKHQNTALRYRVPKKPGTLGFLALWLQQPLTSAQRRYIQTLKPPNQGPLHTWFAQKMSLPTNRIHGFQVQIPSPTKNEK